MGYTCPRCNLPYCSLECYRSESHQNCSEDFYKGCVQQELKGQKASSADRKKIEEILRKEHQEQGEDESDLMEEGKEKSGLSELEERLKGIDFDENPDQIWELLTEDEKRRFEEFISRQEVQNVVDLWEPWWNLEPPNPKITQLDGDEEPFNEEIPPCIDVPDFSPIFERHPPAATVPNSIINVTLSFALIARIYNGDHMEAVPDSSEELFDFCATLRSERNFQTAPEAILNVFEEINKTPLKDYVETMESRVESVKDLLKNLRSPIYVCAALSEVHRLLKKGYKGTARKEMLKASKKVEYFVAYVEMFSELLTAVIPSVASLVGEMEREAVLQTTVSQQVEVSRDQSRPKVEELD